MAQRETPPRVVAASLDAAVRERRLREQTRRRVVAPARDLALRRRVRRQTIRPRLEVLRVHLVALLVAREVPAHRRPRAPAARFRRRGRSCACARSRPPTSAGSATSGRGAWRPRRSCSASRRQRRSWSPGDRRRFASTSFPGPAASWTPTSQARSGSSRCSSARRAALRRSRAFPSASTMLSIRSHHRTCRSWPRARPVGPPRKERGCLLLVLGYFRPNSRTQ